MTRAQANGIEIEYEARGPEDGRPLVLIMGLGTQMIFWPDGFVDRLVERGHRVVRFDNRDAGLSTSFAGAKLDFNAALMAAFTGSGGTAEVPYGLEDMADDVAGLLDALGWSSAHVAGVSMGGMIAQTLAIRHPSRVRSLTSIMSTPEYVEPAPDMLAMLATPMPVGREAAIEEGVRIWRKLAGPGFPPDDAELAQERELIGRAYDRHHDPEATFRQLAAILVAPSRRAALGDVRVPTAVVHGSGDRLIPLIGGEMTAASIPGAELVVIEGMGHDLPRGAWPTMVGAISALTERADAEVRSAAS